MNENLNTDKEFFLGIEGMAAKFSVGVLADNKGTILSAARGEPISLHTIPRDELIIRTNNLIKDLYRKASLPNSTMNITNLCIGLTGTTFSYDREIDLQENVLSQIKPNFKNVICTGDAEIAFLSCARTNSGSIVVSHLGSTVLIIDNIDNVLNFTRFGGWGPFFGDEGSSFHMGSEVLKEISKTYDQKKALSFLWTEVEKWLTKPEPYMDSWERGALCWQEAKEEFHNCCTNNIDPRTLLFYFTHHFNSNIGFEYPSEGFEIWRNITGGLVIPLMKSYEDDEIAREIVSRAVNSLVEQHYGAFVLSKAKNFEPVVLFGGVFNHNPIFADLFKKCLKKKYMRDISFISRHSEMAMRPVCGALSLSLSNSKTQSLKFPKEEIFNNIYLSQKKLLFGETLKNE
jgi:N-acetylglucosamine kinase-like BadF-type ATPase